MSTVPLTKYNLKDRADSALAADITTTATSLTVNAGEGGRFPASNFIIYIENEKILVATRTVDDFSGMTRYHDGTLTASHLSGVRVIHPWESSCYDRLHDNLSGYSISGATVGASGVTIYGGTSGTDLLFRKINPLSNRMSIALSASQIDLDVVENNLSLQNLTGKATGTQLGLEYTSSFLAAGVNLTANTYATGPSINISTGIWMIWGWVTVESNTATANQSTAKLWNGSANPPATTMAAAPSQGTNLRGYVSMHLSTVQTLSTTATWVISVASVGANSVIRSAPALNAPSGTAASVINALRIG